MRSKAQLSVSQIFTYVIALFIVSFVLIFGYRSIAGLKETGEKADFAQFKSKLESSIKLSKGYGDVSNEVLALPPGYEKVCFADLDNPTAYRFSAHGLISNSLDYVSGGTNKVEKNVFLIQDGGGMDSLFVENIKPRIESESETPTDDPKTEELPNDNPCIEVKNSNIRIRFEGQGDKTAILTY
ncbi:MAG: hypothetical protein QF632_03045 [Candidatus Woesearchaeota archaeon]|jgi:hypothetical protein|nr:hypothetical protein [Candidatus Woesearchaeota archaeon]